MATYSYQALKESEATDVRIAGLDRVEVNHRFRSMKHVSGLSNERSSKQGTRFFQISFGRSRLAEGVTNFTMDAALLLKAGMRINNAVALLARESEREYLKNILSDIHARLVSGHSFADALSTRPAAFSKSYVALVKAGEASGALERVLEMISHERRRSAALKRKIGDAIRYPAFLLVAASGVLFFFLMFVLPQFASVLSDFHAKTDAVTRFFISASNALAENKAAFVTLALTLTCGGFLAARNAHICRACKRFFVRAPIVRYLSELHRTALFFRNLQVLHSAAVPISLTLRVIADIMVSSGGPCEWERVVDRVRHGGRISDAASECALLPPVALRMLRLGEESGQVLTICDRLADYYEAKLERALEQMVAVVGPAAIIAISTVIGGLIASVMSSLLSVTQIAA